MSKKGVGIIEPTRREANFTTMRALLPFAWMIATASLFGQSASQSAQAVPAPTQARAESPWELAAGGKRTFDVASVRPSAPDASTSGNEILTPFDGPPFPGGIFSANHTMIAYIIFAYKILDTSQYQVLAASLPSWAQKDKFDIQARAEGNPSKDQMRLMMQSLLEDRFKLAIHVKSKETPVYALVLDKPDKPDKPGPQLQRHPVNDPCINRPPNKPTLSTDSAHPVYCGLEGWQVNGRLHTRMVDVTMEQIATYLGGAGGFLGGLEMRPVLDRTGLSGKFDMNIEFVKEQRNPTSPDTDSSPEGPIFSAALKNQLGLRLIKQNASVAHLVIDHIEIPSPN